MTTLTVVYAAGDRIGLYREDSLEHEGETVNAAAILAWAAREQPFEVVELYTDDSELPYDLADVEIASCEDPDWEMALS